MTVKQKNILLEQLISEQYNDLILEAMSLSDIKQKWYDDIDDDVFNQIVQSDPTYKPEKPDKIGQYAKWLLSLYKQGRLKIEDLYKATQYLTVFQKAKTMKRLENADINKYKSLPELYKAVENFMPKDDGENDSLMSQSDKEKQTQAEAEKVYEDEDYIIVIPHTKEAAIKYGKNTQWCTAATGSYNYFDDYNKEGNLYIIIPKDGSGKYQFHFESNSFMDAHDNPIYKEDFWYDDLIPLVDFFKKERPNDWYLCLYDKIYPFKEGHAIVKFGDDYDSLYSFIDKDGRQITDAIFSYAEDFSHGWALVSADPECYDYNENENYRWEYNFINYDGEFICKEGFESAESFDKHGEAKVETWNGEERTLLTDGSFKDEHWGDYAVETYDNFTIIKYNDKYTVIDKDNHICFEKELWFDEIRGINNGDYVIANKNGRETIIDTNTWEPLMGDYKQLPFKHASEFVDGCARVVVGDYYKDLKTNYLKTDGTFLSGTDFDISGTFHNGYATVIIKDSDGVQHANFINTDGKFTFKNWFTKFKVVNKFGTLKVPYNGNEVLVDGDGNTRLFAEQKERTLKQYIKSVVNEVLIKNI